MIDNDYLDDYRHDIERITVENEEISFDKMDEIKHYVVTEGNLSQNFAEKEDLKVEFLTEKSSENELKEQMKSKYANLENYFNLEEMFKLVGMQATNVWMRGKDIMKISIFEVNVEHIEEILTACVMKIASEANEID